MKFRKKFFGGTRPIITGSPAIGVVGGFTLDKSKINIPVGVIIPAGSLAQYDESTRKSVVLKASRVMAIDVNDAKKLSLESDEFLTPIFVVGDSVLANDATGNFEDAPTIVKVTDDTKGFVVELSAAITGLKVGDALFQVVEGVAEGEGKAPAVFLTDAPQGLSMKSGNPLGTEVLPDETTLDVSVDSKNGMYYEHRIPPIPASFKNGILLKTNPNIKFTQSF